MSERIEMVEAIARAIELAADTNTRSPHDPVYLPVGGDVLATAALDTLLARLKEPSEEMVEAGCRAVYGKNWDGPKNKQPGEAMKEVWRSYPRRILPAALSTLEAE